MEKNVATYNRVELSIAKELSVSRPATAVTSKDQNKGRAEDGVNGTESLLQGLMGKKAVAGRASWMKTELVVKKPLLVQRPSPSLLFLRAF